MDSQPMQHWQRVGTLWCASIGRPLGFSFLDSRRLHFKTYEDWKSFMNPSSYGHARKPVPSFNPNEFGFRRFPRKRPYFKQRKFSKVYCPSTYSPLMSAEYNDTFEIGYSNNYISYARSMERYLLHLFPGIDIQRNGSISSIDFFYIRRLSDQKLLFTNAEKRAPNCEKVLTVVLQNAKYD